MQSIGDPDAEKSQAMHERIELAAIREQQHLPFAVAAAFRRVFQLTFRKLPCLRIRNVMS